MAIVMTYNVYRGGEDRFESIKEVIASVRPDILAIQEACEWESSGRFHAVGRLLGIPEGSMKISHSNSRSSSGRIYDIALYSRYPISDFQVMNDPENIWHSLLFATLAAPKPFHVLVAHLSPKTEDWRLREVPRISGLLTQHSSEPMLLMGDLNSLSPADPYPPSLLQQLQEYGISKFGGDALRFDVITALQRAGWIDTMRIPGVGQGFHITVSEQSEDKDHLDLRLDYIFANKILAAEMTDVRVASNVSIKKASDHSPVVAEVSP
ncbi:MAG: endonuclease/exonuclease/phosphatase family protein [Parcubacteria group bacterium]